MSFAALATLAAVVVHSVARDIRRGRLVIAVGLHAAAPPRRSLQFRTLGLGRRAALGARVHDPHRGLRRHRAAAGRAYASADQRTPRAVDAGAGAVCGVGEPPRALPRRAGGWVAELVGHHAVLPLAFAILYQEYRFALADLFLKRALTLLAVVADCR